MLNILFSIKILLSAAAGGIIVTGGMVLMLEALWRSSSVTAPSAPCPHCLGPEIATPSPASLPVEDKTLQHKTPAPHSAMEPGQLLTISTPLEKVMSVGTPLAASCCLEEPPVCRQQVFCPQQHPPSATSLNCSITRSKYV